MRLNQFWIFIFGSIFLVSLGFSQATESKPTALFSAVFWDRFTSKNISYAPWGNYEDKNATKITLQVGFSAPSQPFAYYGTSPITFFEQVFLEDENKEGSDLESLRKVGQFKFDAESGITKRLFLIFLRQPDQLLYNIISLSLAEENLEFGSFVCYSRCKEALYLAYGKKKQVLEAGKFVKFKQDVVYANESIQLKVFKRSGAGYEEVASDYLALNSARRSLVFLAPIHNRVGLKRYYFNKTPIESSIGYNSVPEFHLSKNVSEENSNNRLNLQ